MHKNFALRPIDDSAAFESNHERYFSWALELLPELEYKNHEVEISWPIAKDQPVQDMKKAHPDLHRMVGERDRLSDSVRVYSAMAVEGFLNWYGVLRVGESVYNEYFERMSLVPKAKAIFLICHSLILEKNSPLLLALSEVAERRNSLVHPKTREVADIYLHQPRRHSRVPHTARESVDYMQRFFSEFAAEAPETEPLLP